MSHWSSCKQSHLQLCIILKVDLLKAGHGAQHTRHAGQAVTFEPNGFQVFQLCQCWWKALIRQPAEH